MPAKVVSTPALPGLSPVGGKPVRANIRVQIQQWVDASNAAVERFGAPGDEYTPF